MAFLALNASPTATSKTHALAAAAVAHVGEGRVVDLCELDAEALLGRRSDPALDKLIEELGSTRCVLIATPVYRASYSGLLKVVFDQLPQEALAGVGCALAATAGTPAHFLSLDTHGRALIASLGGWSAPTVTYATPADFDASGQPSEAVVRSLAKSLAEARLAGGASADRSRAGR